MTMILALDVGNTNIVLGCMTNEEVYFTARLSTNRCKTSHEYAVLIRDILDYGTSIWKK